MIPHRSKIHFVVIAGIICGGIATIGAILLPDGTATYLHISTAVISTATNLIWAME